MTQEELRSLMFTVAAISGAAGGTATMVILSWRTLQWATTQVERARRVTALVAEYPVLTQSVVDMGKVLSGLVVRFEAFEHRAYHNESSAEVERGAQFVREANADAERALQAEERQRVGGQRGTAPRSTSVEPQTGVAT